MIEHWERTVVAGRGENGRYTVETILHRRGEDALGMAMRRNPMMPGYSRFEIRTAEAFTQNRETEANRRRKDDIERDGQRLEEWDW